jgi:hypothetical protein
MSRSTFPEPTTFNGDPVSDPEAEREQALMEDDRERRWWAFEAECRDFAKAEPDGYAAVLRAVARAMKDQGELSL